MLRRYLLAAGLAAIVASPVAAQAGERDICELKRAELEAAKKQIVAANMTLVDAERQAFRPLFDQYQAKRCANTEHRVALVGRYADRYGAMTDVAADSFAKEWLDIEQERSDLAREWYPKFRKVLPAAKAARFMQIEIKLQVLIDYQLAANIPLVPAPQ
jgi:hypothetical protein